MDIDLVTGVIFVVISIGVAITLHELMHALVSYWLGDDTAKEQGRITLNPLAHIDPVMTLLLPLVLFIFHLPMIGAAKPVPFNMGRLRYREYGVAIVALAGPLTNLALAILATVIYNFFLKGAGFHPNLEYFVIIFATFNAIFFAFNIIPIPPLDGSRVFYALSPEFIKSLMNLIERFGFIIVIALVLLASSWLGHYILWILELLHIPSL
ncbi:MAG: site-2 protease family protein [Candidatus Saccharibacteria bacterium]|nr:site-2 protease family protein [Candidatus Saccharibacteria bacterium]MCY4010649.1 site-2 protease family protein [Candidatus Saccharibacteria bacterium]MCY4088640.1 site-2 protease family protein [Candidatus Saccharibacteria bacterium]